MQNKAIKKTSKPLLFNALGGFIAIGPPISLQAAGEVLGMSVTTIARRFGGHFEVRDYNQGGKYRKLRLPRKLIAEFMSARSKRRKKTSETSPTTAPQPNRLEKLAEEVASLRAAVAARPVARPLHIVWHHEFPQTPEGATE